MTMCKISQCDDPSKWNEMKIVLPITTQFFLDDIFLFMSKNKLQRLNIIYIKLLHVKNSRMILIVKTTNQIYKWLYIINPYFELIYVREKM